MLKIRDFARLGEVSMTTLHYYDEIGLLKPIHVDPETGYRFYTMDQLPYLHRILAFKELGLELIQIIEFLTQKQRQLGAMFHKLRLIDRRRIHE